MGKGTKTRRPESATRVSRPSASRARTRSFACPDDLWTEVEDFAARRDLGSVSDAARRLLRSGLHTERVVEEIAATREWQIAEAWSDARAIANGDRAVGSWDAIAHAAEQARSRMRERAAGHGAVAGA